MGILKDSRLQELNKAIGLDPASTPTLDEVRIAVGNPWQLPQK